MKRLELYIHIPFCVRKCAYCDFLSFSSTPDKRRNYLTRLMEEMSFYQNQYRDYLVDTVFFGGGTPSILEGGEMVEIMEHLHRSFQIHPAAEITMECNPGTLNKKKAVFYRKAGINRISFGLQSANNQELSLLGRIHTYEDFLESYGLARKAGFSNINVDLMSALPGQNRKTWKDTLTKVTALEPEHISAYSLIVEEGTPFYEIYHEDDVLREQGKMPEMLPSEEEERAMYEFTGDFLKKAGYSRYEISNYARDGYECRHNVGYWTRRNYLGLGLGASSLVDEVRFRNPSDWDTYMGSSFEGKGVQKSAEYAHQKIFGSEDRERLDKKAAMEEFFFLGLRLTQGVSKDDFHYQFGVNPEEVYGVVLEKLQQEKLLHIQENQIRLTDHGIDVSNYVLSQFLLEEEETPV